jgi:hypothetical protein
MLISGPSESARSGDGEPGRGPGRRPRPDHAKSRHHVVTGISAHGDSESHGQNLPDEASQM